MKTTSRGPLSPFECVTQLVWSLKMPSARGQSRDRNPRTPCETSSGTDRVGDASARYQRDSQPALSSDFISSIDCSDIRVPLGGRACSRLYGKSPWVSPNAKRFYCRSSVEASDESSPQRRPRRRKRQTAYSRRLRRVWLVIGRLRPGPSISVVSSRLRPEA